MNIISHGLRGSGHQGRGFPFWEELGLSRPVAIYDILLWLSTKNLYFLSRFIQPKELGSSARWAEVHLPDADQGGQGMVAVI